ncbi:DENN domain-containing protein 4C-like [Amphibalanus amphitrite]|uniref:DENN domain-containing protein 4C-like n=1 Tax=Amphibalanus amphitrite TaxID=1232801 RepID=UPI001C91E7C6|nr:DENN domain-containing protein 4C-like isoform X1 [Amphibalanus amphitrite]XP_043207830.1 DENN domain-containing protein 4C-like isoform X1 [Amphibalanus amphitrite]XP_043207831.1 DENN domain-containing protein 4C-like isoform X1 [Amphibalanus amphitrite]XP_043217013.1 DENN domain-containing protein 4C-like [Amphibalanus amphitrite]
MDVPPDRQVADYFIHCGLPEQLCELDAPLEDFPLKPSHNYAPITDVAVIFPSEEPVPSGYRCIEKTPTGLSADLNHGSIRSPEVLLCYKRGWDKPPLVDIGVLYDGKEYVMPDSQVVEFTPTGRIANVNNSTARTYITYRRASDSSPCNELVVTDICVIVLTKDEVPPHTYCIIPKTLNKGMVGSDVYICYKKSMRQPTRVVYKPGLLGRFPLEDRPYFPLPESVPMFCLPMGATVECWPSQAATPKPVFSTFVFTVADGAEKVYGSSITFYERYPDSRLTEQQRLQLGIDTHHPSEISVNANKSIGVLSHWPFFDTFEKFLQFLHQTAISGRPTSVPLERYISHILLEVPFPSVARPYVHVQLDGGAPIVVAQPYFSPLPQSGASFCKLLKNLGPDNSLLVLLFTLTEQKLLLHSLRPDVLTRVAEAVSMMIFPCLWQCPYIPLCPLGLADILSAPVPFLVGLDSRYFDMYDPPPEVTCVDLDTNTIFVAEEKRHLVTKLLPKKACKQLRHSLEAVFDRLYSMSRKRVKGGSPEMDLRVQRMEHQLEIEIQEAFLRFMATILRGYQAYLKPIKSKPTTGTTDPSSLFNLDGFLKSRDKAYQPFYQMLTTTQSFIRFIEERSFVSDKDAYHVFFDECLAKDLDSPDCRLLESETPQSERTVFVPPPEQMEGRQFVYHEFGELHRELFLARATSLQALPRPLPAVGSAAQLAGLAASGAAAPSPLVRRTKHEVMSARKQALKQAETPALWARYLVGTCFSLWFVHLPSYVEVCDNSKAAMDEAFQIMVVMQKILNQSVDEVCYRVMMQLCGQHQLPVLAVKVLYKMKQLGIHPNALTYGYYNKAVLESEWPTDTIAMGRLLWSKLRNVVLAAAEFRAGPRRSDRKGSSSQLGSGDPAASSQSLGHTMLEADRASCSSLGSSRSAQSSRPDGRAARPSVARALNFGRLDFSESDRFRSRVGSIVKTSGSRIPGSPQVTNYDSSAGVLMVSCPEDAPSAGPLSGGSSAGGSAAPASARHPLDSPHQEELRARHLSCSETPEHQQISLLRSTSFAGDDQILACLREMGHDSLDSAVAAAAAGVPAGAGDPGAAPGPGPGGGVSAASTPPPAAPPAVRSRSASQDISLEERINEYYSGEGDRRRSDSRERSADTRSVDSLELPTDPLGVCGLQARTPVTENDPLGALGLSESPTRTPPAAGRLSASLSQASSYQSRKASLFKAEPFSDGFDRPGDQVEKNGKLPSPGSGSALAGFRLPFSASSKLGLASNLASYNLRRAERRFRRSIDTITPELDGLMKTYSPASLKNHELVKSGVSSIRSAATSMYKKLDELKEVMSSQSPALTKTMSLTSIGEDDVLDDMRHAGSAEVIPGFSEAWCDGLFNDTHSSSELAVPAPLPPALPAPLAPVAVELALTSCSRCYKCQATVYDEEIMAGWSAEESNLNTKCPFCRKPFVPLLTVHVRDFRNVSREQRAAEQLQQTEGTAGVLLDPITLPYLSPLVLRKEVENVMDHDGQGCLSAATFVDEHPIIYWNLVWYMQRISVPSHLPGLCLHCRLLEERGAPADGWEQASWRHVQVRCLWDNPKLHDEIVQPMYVQWKESPLRSSLVDALVTDDLAFSKNTVQSVLSCVQCTTLDAALCTLSSNIGARRMRDKHFSTYRDIMFLAFAAMGRENIDLMLYDREYRRAYEELPEEDRQQLNEADRPPSNAALLCRRFFRELET